MKSARRYSYEEALQYAAGICARSEQCEFDIRRKLASHGVFSSEADKIIDYLYDNRFLDEMRYSRAFARDKARFNRWGKIKIRAALAAKRVSNEAIRAALETIDEEEYTSGLKTLVLQFSKSNDLSERDTRLRLARRLAARGFESHLIFQIISETAEEE